MHANDREAWEKYRKEELQQAIPLLTELGFILDEEQVQIGGERFLMMGSRDVGGGGRKLVLTGKRKRDNRRVIMKISSDKDGIQEMERERYARQTLHKLPFAHRAFFTPEEILFEKRGSHLASVTAYIHQEGGFIDRPLDEQFFLALRALETQEGVHATTYSHAATVKEVFGMANAQEYLSSFEVFKTSAISCNPQDTGLAHALQETSAFLQQHQTVIERYCGFLTHADFFPHNLRIVGKDIYLLDHASIRFGNKYESWARFLNFMTQFNPALEKALCDYVRNNRGDEEYLCLRLMRAYKLGFLLHFYAHSLRKTSGDLHAMMQLRIAFWTEALGSILRDQQLPHARVQEFLSDQERLRSEEEKKRNRAISARQ